MNLINRCSLNHKLLLHYTRFKRGVLNTPGSIESMTWPNVHSSEFISVYHAFQHKQPIILTAPDSPSPEYKSPLLPRARAHVWLWSRGTALDVAQFLQCPMFRNVFWREYKEWFGG